MKTLRIRLAIVLVVLAGRAFNGGAQTVTILRSFGSSPTDAQNPQAGLVQGSDGNFYGTTSYGGTNDYYGTVFRISPSDSYTSLYSFGSSPTDGQNPQAGLVQGSDGNFYGTTLYGGTNGNGTIFRISPSGSYTTLYFFAGYPIDGSYPQAGLVQGSDGNFYGTTLNGGTNGDGTVFQINPAGTYTNLYTFGSSPTDGQNPQAGLVQGNDGNFYGTTYAGGTDNGGTVFRINPSGTYTTVYRFGSSPTDGLYPEAGLVQGSDGNFYGTTLNGGTNGYGTVFRIDTNGSETIFYFFGSSPTDAQNPQAGLVQGSDGNLYGTTLYGGTNSNGTIFRISPSGTYTTLYQFGSSPTDGAEPDDVVLVQGSDGDFYGTTEAGGAHGLGIVFELDMGLGPLSTSCRYSLGTDTADVSDEGGSGSVTVTANGTSCPWTATSNDSFIAITAGANRTGNGTVSYTVTANSGAARTGTMTIAGQAFAVYQAGATLGFSFTNVVQTCKTKTTNDKKTETTNTTTTCTVAFDLVVSNTGVENTPKFSVLLWLGQGSAFNPNIGTALPAKNVKALKKGTSDTIKMKSKKLTGDQASTYIFATDTENNVLAFAEVPGP